MSEYLDYQGLQTYTAKLLKQLPAVQAVSLTTVRSLAATTTLDLQNDEASYDTATTLADTLGHDHSQLLVDGGKTATNIYAWGNWIGHNGGLMNYSSGDRSLIIALDNTGQAIPADSIVRIDHSAECGIAITNADGEATITSTGNAYTIVTTHTATRLGLMFARYSYVYNVTIHTPNGDKQLTVTQRGGSTATATIASPSKFALKEHRHVVADITDHPEPLDTSDIDTLISKYF